MAAQTYTIDELFTLIVLLSDEARNLQHQVSDQVSQRPARDDPMTGGPKGFLFDKKPFEPEDLERATRFKEWSEDFAGWVEHPLPRPRVQGCDH